MDNRALIAELLGDDPWTRAAARTRGAVVNRGNEGLATKLLEGIGDIPKNMVGAAAGMVDAAKDYAAENTGTAQTLSTDYDPRRLAAALGAETAMNVVGTPAFTGGVPAVAVGSGARRVWNPLNDSDVYKQRALDMANEGRGSTVKVYETSDAMIRAQGGPKPMDDVVAGWRSDRGDAVEDYRRAVFPERYGDEPMRTPAQVELETIPFSNFTDRKTGAGLVGANQSEDVRTGIRAYHGSPHDFDRFDLSKIGTGEGAQAYGHGLYFAGNENVARQYRDQLAKDMYYSPDGRMFDPQSQLQHLNVRVAARNNGTDLDATIARAQELAGKGYMPDATRAMIEHDLAILNEFKAAGGIAKNPGRMYEVNINAAPEQFLDWDRPLSGQSGSIQEAIAKIDQQALKPAPKMSEIRDMDIRNIVREALRQNEGTARDLSLIIDNDSRLYSAAVNHARKRGVDLEAKDMRASDYVYDQSGGFLNKLLASQEHTGEALHRLLGAKGTDKMEQAPVAGMLRDAGIPGIKYLDQVSRAAGDGSRNYVVFDDKIIDILRKYGITGAAATSLLAEALEKPQQ